MRIANNLKDVKAYYLDFKCARNNHNDYELCVRSANAFSETPTLVSKLLQPIYNLWHADK
jgi:hypothetical protein